MKMKYGKHRGSVFWGRLYLDALWYAVFDALAPDFTIHFGRVAEN